MVDTFVEDVDEAFRRGIYKIPIADNLEELKEKMVDALIDRLIKDEITEAQFIHTYQNIVEYELHKAAWFGSNWYHIVRLGIDWDTERLSGLPIVEALSGPNKPQTLVERGFTEADIKKFIERGFLKIEKGLLVPAKEWI